MRKYYLDNIRWITVILVVIYHVFYMYNAEGILGGLGKITSLPVQYYDVYQYFVYPWFMPVLFLVSGCVSRIYLERHKDREFVKSRTRKLLVPSTIGLFVFQFIQGYVSMTIGDGFLGLSEAGVPKPVIYLIMVASGSGVLWFIHLLWLYSMALILLRRCEKGRLLQLGARTPIWFIPFFCIPVWGAAQILNTPIISVYRVAFYFVFFILGYYVFSNDEVIERLRNYAVVLITAGVVLCLLFSIVYFGRGANYADKPVNRTLLFAACAYFGSLAMLSGMARFGDCSSRFTTWMSTKSFGLYVFHYLGISSVALWIAKPGILPAPACYLLSLAAGFVFGYGLYEIISRLPFFRWAVLGIKREKKENV
ncbi:MAG: acyltransferase family protein [Eubacteriales bacterium]|nr:acyltransferase family protein [Eubacteriales bacterium]